MKKKFIDIAYDFNVLIIEVQESTGVFNNCDMLSLQRRNRAIIALSKSLSVQQEILRRCALKNEDFIEHMSEYGTLKEALKEYNKVYLEEKEKLKEFLQLDLCR
ncbi:hypothetical protein [Cetobacterium sp.]|uniref:hypothetical protein n=1 Tax=Cetobacterium sp. TaxID=2071632 RepID=UPI003F386260